MEQEWIFSSPGHMGRDERELTRQTVPRFQEVS